MHEKKESMNVVEGVFLFKKERVEGECETESIQVVKKNRLLKKSLFEL